MVTINKTVKQFIDLDLNFLPHPVTGDVVRSYDADSINKNLKYLILTQNYEVPFHPEIGCQVNGLLFEEADYMTIQLMQRTIENAIQNFEPRVALLSVEVVLDNTHHAFNVTIVYRIVNTLQPVTFNLLLKRTR